jgi:hypothetical protein
MLLLAMMEPTPAQAQDRTWKLDAEVGASAFFGASQQTTVHTRGAWEWTTEVWEWSVGGAFDYGETRDPDRGRFVSKRAWTLAGAADYRPMSRFSPFVFASGEGSLKRQIDSRVSGGVGGRYRLIEDDRTRIDFSLAALLERTDSRLDATGPEEVTVNGRWSARFRARRSFSDERLRFDLVSFYKPRITRFTDHTVQVAASTQYALTRIVSVKLSLLDTYDSLADDRGAPSNHDGQLLFSVLASIQ